MIRRNGDPIYSQTRTLLGVDDAWNVATVSSDGMAVESNTVFTYDPTP